MKLLKSCLVTTLKTTIIISIASLITISIGAYHKRDRINNFYRYLKYDEPYVNRSLLILRHLMEYGDKNFEMVVFNRNLQDNRGHFPNFFYKIDKQLTVDANPSGINEYREFLRKYQSLISDPGLVHNDEGALAIMNLVYYYHKKNYLKERKDLPASFISEPDYRAEDFVYYLVNEMTGCGEVAEATVALLRGAGYQARVVRLSHDPDGLVANHVFPEFYSEKQGKWVMMEPMINQFAGPVGFNLSSFEMMASEIDRQSMNNAWAEEYRDITDEPLEYRKDYVIWFDKRGVVTNFYYFSSSPITNEILSNKIVHN